MEPKAFMDHWGISRAELSQLCGKSLDTVHRWFSDREAPTEIKQMLSCIHQTWLIRQTIEETSLPHIEAVYELVRARKRLEKP